MPITMLAHACRPVRVNKEFALGNAKETANVLESVQQLTEGVWHAATKLGAPNKSLKAVRVRSLDSPKRRMLRIICAACVCPLALRYAVKPYRRIKCQTTGL